MQLAHLLAKNDRFDIWRYHDFLGEIAPDFWVSDQRKILTPLEQKTNKLWIKHEDFHPIGSHKGRSIAYQLSVLRSIQAQKLVLSSSGNAAIALVKLNQFFPAFVFVSSRVDPAREAELLASEQTYTRCISTPFPRNFAHYLVNKHGYVDMRPSQNDDAIVGLRTLGLELAEQLPDLDASYSIYIVTTSGANTLGMYQGFNLLLERGLLNSLPKLFPVLMPTYTGGTLTPARRKQLEAAVAHTKGKILEQEPEKNAILETSFEGNTAYRAYEKHHSQAEKAIIVFTGKQWPLPTKTAHLKQYATINALKADYLL